MKKTLGLLISSLCFFSLKAETINIPDPNHYKNLYIDKRILNINSSSDFFFGNNPEKLFFLYEKIMPLLKQDEFETSEEYLKRYNTILNSKIDKEFYFKDKYIFRVLNSIDKDYIKYNPNTNELNLKLNLDRFDIYQDRYTFSVSKHFLSGTTFLKDSKGNKVKVEQSFFNNFNLDIVNIEDFKKDTDIGGAEQIPVKLVFKLDKNIAKQIKKDEGYTLNFYVVCSIYTEQPVTYNSNTHEPTTAEPYYTQLRAKYLRVFIEKLLVKNNGKIIYVKDYKKENKYHLNENFLNENSTLEYDPVTNDKIQINTNIDK